MNERKCTKCEIVKPIAMFYTNGNDSEGLTKWATECKACNVRRAVVRRRAHDAKLRRARGFAPDEAAAILANDERGETATAGAMARLEAATAEVMPSWV